MAHAAPAQQVIAFVRAVRADQVSQFASLSFVTCSHYRECNDCEEGKSFHGDNPVSGSKGIWLKDAGE
jgi:hypothetical protein